MPRSSRDEEFSAFVQTRRTGLVRSACLLTAGAFPDGLAGGEVRAALAALPSGMRAAIVPRHWLDLSAGETAELLNCSEGTVKSLTFQIAGGQWVVVQAPVSLGWNSAELAKFASGVQVLVTAQQGQG